MFNTVCNLDFHAIDKGKNVGGSLTGRLTGQLYLCFKIEYEVNMTL